MAFKDQTVSAMLWSFAGAAGVQIIGLVFSFVIMRLIGPEVFGLFTLPLIVSLFARQVIDVGLGAAIIQRSTFEPRLVSSVFWLNLGLSVAVALGIFLSAPYLAAYVGKPEVSYVFELIAPVFLITGLTVTQKSILSKQMNFKMLAIAEFLSTVAGGSVAVFLALRSPDVNALIGRFAAAALVTSLVYWIATKWRPSFSFQTKGLREVLGFGLPFFGTKILAFSTKYIDELIFPKFMGTDIDILGTYNRTKILTDIPTKVVKNQFINVLFPAFSSIQDETERMADVYGKTISLSAVFGLLPLSLIFLLVPEAVPILLGEPWILMIPMAQAIVLMLAPGFLSYLGPVILSRGKSKLNLQIRLLIFVIRAVSIYLGFLYGGLNGLLISLIVFGWLTHFIDLWFIGRELDRGIWWQFRLELPGWVVHIACIGLAWATAYFLGGSLSIWLALLVKVIVFCTAFIAILILLKPRGFMVGLRLAKEYHYKLGPLGSIIKKL